jgi:RNA polymerase sigma-70 factor (ECF subfamily)
VSRTDPFANSEQLIRRVYSYIAYLVGDGAGAEDLTSETIERALRYRNSYDPAKGTPTSWVLGIARRCVADRDAPSLPLPEGELPGATDADVDFGVVDRITVRAAVARLPQRDQELIALRYGADLSARQIAEHLNERQNAVEVALHRAHKRLRVELRGDYETRQRAVEGPAAGAL